MNQKELKELIEFLKEQDIAEFELERGDVKVRIKRGMPVAIAPAALTISAPTVPTAAAASPAPPSVAPPTKSPDEGLHQVKSPIVGTFYESPSPGSPPFVKAGDTVEAGQVLCIIEAMKLMNEIEADVSGEVVKRLVNNGQPVEYGQPLFSIRPR
ncbi:MAG TPA: acetyl-CoA carboxylase biotin carboxyl carrier protein [Candidatus Sulfotelmatobacter sp.]|nr:acetyl-CoA carboxylase biotin carboxyl carrier protein [Candidatus Sulfotelmatobacter sp.]